MNDSMRLTVAQAVVRFLQSQYSEADGQQERLIAKIFGIFGHGNVAAFGQALEEYGAALPFFQPKNEQSMVHAAIGYAKARRRRSTLACTASIGPGSSNMLSGAATATINRVPVLLFPSDTFASRRPGNVLQQIEHPVDADVTVNDAFRPISRFFDRISRPEQLIDSLPEAMRVLTDPADTGTVCVSLPQDLQGEVVELPAAFLEKRVWTIRRPPPTEDEIRRAAELLASARRPLIIAGGGVRYSDASQALIDFANRFGIPVSETHAGRGVARGVELHLGGQGLNGTSAAGRIAETADVVICLGTRLSDFTTASRSAFQNPQVRFIGINVNGRDAYKLSACPVVADARVALEMLGAALSERGYATDAAYGDEIRKAIAGWWEAYTKVATSKPGALMQQTTVFAEVNAAARDNDVVVAAAGAAPGEIQKGWNVKSGAEVLLEFGYSCMGHEIPAALGVRLARPGAGEVYVVIGDGTYLMQPTELVTAVQHGLKVTVVLIENNGYQCIRELQEATTGSKNFGNEFRMREGDDVQPNGDYVAVDYVANAASMGCRTYLAEDTDSLRKALADARKETRPTVIVARVDPRSEGISAGLWWDLGLAEVSGSKLVNDKFEKHEAGRSAQRVLV